MKDYPKPGDTVYVMRYGDNWLDASLRPFIEHNVEVVKITKGGLVEVKLGKRVTAVPKYMLTFAAHD